MQQGGHHLSHRFFSKIMSYLITFPLKTRNKTHYIESKTRRSTLKKTRKKERKKKRTTMQQKQEDAKVIEGVQLLKTTSVGELVKNAKRLVEVPYRASVTDTLNVLLANNILAVPVAAPPGEWLGAGGSMIMQSDKSTGTLRKHYIGIVTTIDILIHIADEAAQEHDIEKRLMHTPISSLIGHSIEGLSLWCINPSTSVYEVMESFGRGIHRALIPIETDIHHVGIEFQEASPGYKMLTQMDIVQFLKVHREILKPFTSASIGSLGAVQTGAFAAPANMTVANAVKCMRSFSLNAVAIVEPNPEDEQKPALIPGIGRRLVGTFSATDLRACPASKLQTWLSLSVLEFTEMLSRGEIFQHNIAASASAAALSTTSPGSRPLITCNMTSTIEEVISKAVDFHVHRVWVVEREEFLVGLIALTDLLHAIHSSTAIQDISSKLGKHPD